VITRGRRMHSQVEAGLVTGRGTPAGSAGRPGRPGVDIGAGFEAEFLGPLGQVVRQRWQDAAWAVAFEDLQSVSAFPVVPGRRWGPGLWCSSTTGGHVSAGSSAMRMQLMVLDRDPHVTGLAGRPVRLMWRESRGRARAWTPQLFARYTDGTALLADCPGRADAGGQRALDAAAALEAACARVGWTYKRLQPLEEVPAANVKWLAGYRHPRNTGRPGLMEAVLEAFAEPRPLIDGVHDAGDPIEVLPAVFHALWNRSLEVSLDAPLHERALVSPAAPPDTGRRGADHGTGAPDGTGGPGAVGTAGPAGTDSGTLPGPSGKDPGRPDGAAAPGRTGHRSQEAR
jgi:hypothetical protein